MELIELREIRKSKGMRLNDLSGITGINRYRLSLIERGKVNPSWGSVVRILDALGCDLIFLKKR